MATSSIPSGTADAAVPGSAIGTLLCRIVVPGWVLAGALFKLIERDPKLLPPPVLDVVRWLATTLGIENAGAFLGTAMRSMIAVELIAVGLMLFAPKLARSVAFAILSIFLVVLVATLWKPLMDKGIDGVLSGSCGCFGSKGPPAWVMFLIDGVLWLGVLFFAQGPKGRSRPSWPVSGVAGVASLVVGTGLAFGVPDRVIVIAPPPAPEVTSAQTPPNDGETKPTPPVQSAASDGGADETAAAPWPDQPKVDKLYFTDFGKWVGKRLDQQPLALQISRPLPEGINKGRWHVVFYRTDCDHCFEVLNKHFVGALPAPTIAVSIPDTTGRPLPFPCKACERHTLPKGPDYVIGVPAILTVQDGVVVGACTDKKIDEPGAIEAVLNAGLNAGLPGKESAGTGSATPATPDKPAPNPNATKPTAAASPFPPLPTKAEPYYTVDFPTWVGKRLDAQPMMLLINRPIPIELNSGPRIVVLYRVDCDHCHDLLMTHFSGALPAPTLAVAIPDTDGEPLEMPCAECKLTSLVPGPQYVVETPVLITLKDGVIQAVVAGEAAEDPAAVEAALKTLK